MDNIEKTDPVEGRKDLKEKYQQLLLEHREVIIERVKNPLKIIDEFVRQYTDRRTTNLQFLADIRGKLEKPMSRSQRNAIFFREILQRHTRYKDVVRIKAALQFLYKRSVVENFKTWLELKTTEELLKSNEFKELKSVHPDKETIPSSIFRKLEMTNPEAFLDGIKKEVTKWGHDEDAFKKALRLTFKNEELNSIYSEFKLRLRDREEDGLYDVFVTIDAEIRTFSGDTVEYLRALPSESESAEIDCGPVTRTTETYIAPYSDVGFDPEKTETLHDLARRGCILKDEIKKQLEIKPEEFMRGEKTPFHSAAEGENSINCCFFDKLLMEILTDQSLLPNMNEAIKSFANNLPALLNQPDENGDTALHIAAGKGNREMSKFLCDEGANILLTNNKGISSLHIMNEKLPEVVLELLNGSLHPDGGCGQTLKVKIELECVIGRSSLKGERSVNNNTNHSRTSNASTHTHEAFEMDDLGARDTSISIRSSGKNHPSAGSINEEISRSVQEFAPGESEMTDNNSLHAEKNEGTSPAHETASSDSSEVNGKTQQDGSDEGSSPLLVSYQSSIPRENTSPPGKTNEEPRFTNPKQLETEELASLVFSSTKSSELILKHVVVKLFLDLKAKKLKLFTLILMLLNIFVLLHYTYFVVLVFKVTYGVTAQTESPGNRSSLYWSNSSAELSVMDYFLGNWKSPIISQKIKMEGCREILVHSTFLILYGLLMLYVEWMELKFICKVSDKAKRSSLYSGAIILAFLLFVVGLWEDLLRAEIFGIISTAVLVLLIVCHTLMKVYEQEWPILKEHMPSTFVVLASLVGKVGTVVFSVLNLSIFIGTSAVSSKCTLECQAVHGNWCNMVLSKLRSFNMFVKRSPAYFRNVENSLQLIFAVMMTLVAFCALLIMSGITKEFWIWLHPVSMWSVVVAWVLILQQIGNIYGLGIYIQMFNTVLRRFVSLFALFLAPVIGFSIAFSIAFPWDKDRRFGTFPAAFFRITAMIEGELNYDDLFQVNVTRPFPYATNWLHFAFIVMVPGVLISLLIGLAVDDISKILKKSEVIHRRIQIERLYVIERLISYFGFDSNAYLVCPLRSAGPSGEPTKDVSIVMPETATSQVFPWFQLKLDGSESISVKKLPKLLRKEIHLLVQDKKKYLNKFIYHED